MCKRDIGVSAGRKSLDREQKNLETNNVGTFSGGFHGKEKIKVLQEKC